MSQEIIITIVGDEKRADEIMDELADTIAIRPIAVYPGIAVQIHECPDDVRDIVEAILK